MKLLLTYLFLSLSWLAHAQGVSVLKGRIVDLQGNPVPGAYVNLDDSSTHSYSNSLGYYYMNVPANELLHVHLTYLQHHKASTIAPLDAGVEYRVDFTITAVFELDAVTTNAQRDRPFISVVEIEPKSIEGFPVASGFEQTLKSIAIGVSTGGGELSSGYNVRGGNFDENLVYVNDIEVYRPFLARSGQQEGLSIINTDLVERIRFSAGGFEAKYGDKLSSVLDIRYRQPDSSRATARLSLMGAQFHFEGSGVQNRLSYLVGVRYRSNQYLLGSLDVQGDYKPRFYDVQSLTRFRLTSDLDLEWFASFAQNRYLVAPQSQTTNFGNVNSAFQLFVAFGGKELMQYNTLVNGLKFHYTPDESTDLKLIFNAYQTAEREHFTVEGAYRLDELETNLGSDNFANVRRNLGLGYFIDNARNDLRANVFNIAHKGHRVSRFGMLLWGADVKWESIADQLNEWRYNDSSGYNINTFSQAQQAEQILLDEHLKADIGIRSARYSAYVQHKLTLDTASALKVVYGLRTNYWTYNKQNVISPRAQISWQPNKKFNDTLFARLENKLHHDSLKRRDWVLKAAFGYYYQPPFYRELRDLNGVINPDLRAQRSIHFVVGGDMNFTAWGRPFKFISEVYYKKLDDMVPYVIDNVRIRYLAENSSQGYATGFDARVNGEFISGVESWLNLSLLSTKERLYYTNEAGERVLSDWLRRPTDQRINFSILFQDELPSNPSYKMNLNLIFGSRIPFFFNGQDRYKEGFTISPYRRVDIGFSKSVFDQSQGYRPDWLRSAESLWVSLEVFNLLQVNNIISYSLIKDFENNVYGIPNYLTGRRVNVRLVAKF